MAVTEEQAAAWAARSRADESTPEAMPPAQVRRTLGEFELLSELGRGGMGIVYRAWQPSLGRQVALKRLQQVGDARTDTRFRREIRALGKVEHPHLVKVFTSGTDGTDWFYAMELIEGAPLSAVCEQLQASSSAAAIDLQTWQEAVSTVCQATRKAENPLGSSGDGPPSATSAPTQAPTHAAAAPTRPHTLAGRE
jgi:hypothetical protein